MQNPVRSDVQQLLDLEAIRQLVQRYAVAACSRNPDDLAALFDPEVQNGRWGPGREGTRAWYANFFGNDTRTHFFFAGNHQVDLDDSDADRATGVAFTRYMTPVPDAPGRWFDSNIVYFDTYRRYEGTWGFVRRIETVATRTIIDEAPPAEVAAGRRPLPSTSDMLAQRSEPRGPDATR